MWNYIEIIQWGVSLISYQPWCSKLFLVLGFTFILIQWYTLFAGLASKVARKDSLARFLENRPDQKDLENRNILHTSSEDEASTDRHDKVVKLGRKLSMRPTAEELENRNILHHGMLGFYSCCGVINAYSTYCPANENGFGITCMFWMLWYYRILHYGNANIMYH